MERYTEYHNGIAVIRDKSKLKEAMQKLASYEDVEDYSDTEKTTTEFAEYICDKLCKYPCIYDQEELDEYCAECKMAEFICGICNCFADAHRLAIETLEKQIPKKPNIHEGFMTVARCPVCNEITAFKNEYCSGCGQKLDWSKRDD